MVSVEVNKVISTHAVPIPEVHTRQHWPRILPPEARSSAVERINTYAINAVSLTSQLVMWQTQLTTFL